MIKQTQLLYFFTALVFTFTLVSCEDDFSDLNTSIKGVKNFDTESKLFPVVAYTKALKPVQTNNLSSNLIGVYNDPSYGSTTASFVTQVTPATITPNFGKNPKLVSVVLNIPYYSTLLKKEGDINTYKLDSLYGNLNPESSFKLSIYQNKYLLRSLDPDTGFEDQQAYYANELPKFEAQLGKLLYENANFLPSPLENVIAKDNPKDGEDKTERIPPGLRINLLTTDNYWENLFFKNQDNTVLTNIDNFKNFFRGLVFKVENTGTSNCMLPLNILSENASITITYTNENKEDENVPTKYTLKFSGQRVNTFQNDFSISDGDNVKGDQTLKLKGMQGSMAVIDLFKGTITNANGTEENALDYFKSKKDDWLINEANLIFHVDNTKVKGEGTARREPKHLIVYNLETNIPIADYILDKSSSKTTHAVPLQIDKTGKGTTYKIRLTEHINTILKSEENLGTTLGVYVTNNISNPTISKLYGVSGNDKAVTVRKVSRASIFTPSGTYIYGNTNTVPKDKRLEFKIYYTKPKTQ